MSQTSNQHLELPPLVHKRVLKEAQDADNKLWEDIKNLSLSEIISKLRWSKVKLYIKKETEKWAANERALEAQAQLISAQEEMINKLEGQIESLKKQIK